MECNIGQDAIYLFSSFGNALLFRYIYKGSLVKNIGKYIAFLFCKEIYI